jgi:hypothetical protein
MRAVSLIPAIVALFLSSAASAQVWEEYVNRDDFFQVNFPGEPTVTEMPYRTVKGTNLTARVFSATAPAGSITAGSYRVTVIDYSSAQGELGDAIEQARQAMLKKGTAKYDGRENLDMHRSWRVTVETPTSRILGEILIAANNRVYIVEGETALNIPPAAQFQASIQILNNEGVRIRERTEIAAPTNETANVGEAFNAAEAQRITNLVSGSWRNPAGGSCEAAYFKSGMRAKSKRGEEALNGTVANSGVTVPAQLIIVGAREGQIVDPSTDRPIFLFDSVSAEKLHLVAIGAPAIGWPEVTLELCPGSRG